MNAKYPPFFDQLPSSRSFSPLNISFYFYSRGLIFHLFSAIFAHIHPYTTVERPSKFHFRSANSTDAMADSIRVFPNVWFKSAPPHPPPGEDRGHHTNFGPDPPGHHLLIMPDPWGHHRFYRPKKWCPRSCPGGGWGGADLNHTLWRKKWKMLQIVQFLQKRQNIFDVNFGYKQFYDTQFDVVEH